jgi:hypothetical protein
MSISTLPIYKLPNNKINEILPDLNKKNEIQSHKIVEEKIDADGIIKITNNFFDKLSTYLPKPVFKLPSLIYGLKISGIITIILLIILIIVLLIINPKIRKSYNYSILRIKYYKDNKIIKIDNLKIDKKIKKKNINKFYDKDNKLIRIEIEDFPPAPLRIQLTLIFIVIIIIFISLFKFLSDMHYNRRLRFANPYHRTLIDYLLRFFYTLKWGKSKK